jgi:hypothetical protein
MEASMGGGHDHGHAGGGAHAAGHGHGHASSPASGHAQGHDAGHHQGAATAHGGEIPPAPARRSITPAPEDFVNLPGPSAVVYPLLWLAAAALLVVALVAGGWSLHHQDGHGPDAPSAGH